MKDWKKKLENFFAAVAFAEADDDDTALRTAQLSRSSVSAYKVFEDTYAAAAFAEAGLPEVASRMATADAAPKRSSKPSLSDFLQDVGLQGAHLHYGVARI